MDPTQFSAASRAIGRLGFGLWGLLILSGPVLRLLGADLSDESVSFLSLLLKVFFGVGVLGFVLYGVSEVVRGYREPRG